MSLEYFVQNWVNEINNNLLKDFPRDFIDNKNCESLTLLGKPLVKGSELFGNFEITDIEGNTFLSTSNLYKVKFILYANRTLPVEIKIPKIDSGIENSVKKYEEHLDNLFFEIQNDFKRRFKSTKNFTTTVNNIFRKLNLNRF